jgi:hypothetical protein
MKIFTNIINYLKTKIKGNSTPIESAIALLTEVIRLARDADFNHRVKHGVWGLEFTDGVEGRIKAYTRSTMTVITLNQKRWVQDDIATVQFVPELTRGEAKKIATFCLAYLKLNAERLEN